MTGIPRELINDAFHITQGNREKAITEKHQELKSTIIGLYDPRVWFMTDAALAVHVACILRDTANPIGLIIVDGPSSEKTTVLDFFEGLPMNHWVDKFTPASFLTQSANVKESQLKKVDLLPKIAYKTMIVPEMAPLFSQPKEILMESYAILARVLDGRGLSSSGGVHGHRELKGDYIFNLLGATTPLSQTAWNTMGKVGSRLTFLHVPSRLSRHERMKRSKAIMTSNLHYATKRRMAKQAIRKFTDFFFSQFNTEDYTLPEDVPEHLQSKEALLRHCGYLPRSFSWDSQQDDEDVIDIMSQLAEFATKARSDLRIWTEQQDGHTETNSTGAVVEGVDRLTSILYSLAKSHALVSGCGGVSREQLPLIVAVTLSSLPDNRMKAVELLVDPTLKYKKSAVGTFTIHELMKSMSCSDGTATKVMRALELLGLGEIEGGVGQTSSTFRLNEDYEWFITDEFRQYFRSWDEPKLTEKRVQERVVPFPMRPS